MRKADRDEAPIASDVASAPHDTDFIAYHAKASASRTACVELSTNTALTYAQLDARIARCAGWLAALLAPEKGARVAMLARNCIDHLVLHFACVRAGAICQPLNWRLAGPELAALVRDAEPALFVYQPEFADAALEAIAGVRHVLQTGPALSAAIDAAEPLDAPPGDGDAPIALLYTSGTTGRSKGVIITRRNAWTTALNFAMLNEVAARDVLLCDMPLFHVAGLSGVCYAALFMGATVLISDRFVPDVTLARLSDPALGITHFFAVPQMAIALRQDPAYAASDLKRLKALVIGGAPLPKVVVDQYLADGVMPIEGYGLSEAGTVLGMPLDSATIARKSGSCGVRALAIDVRLVTTGGSDAGEDEVGELWLKGPSVTPGYWNQPEATAKSFSDGWYKTGDAATRDGEGFYRIVDRWKDMYISGGENVYPAEVESVLAEHDDIAEAAIVGVADERWGEVGCAYIVPRPGRTPRAEAIIEHCRVRLAGYKTPRHVRFVDALPRTGSGKVRKDELRRAWSSSE